ncbi:hypothetical protein EVA_11965, partial [gut metagenome]
MAFASDNAAAIAVAKNEIPADSEVVNSYLDEGRYNINFRGADGVRYDVEVFALTNKVLEVEIDRVVNTKAQSAV